jgi:hypothetical protein
VRATTVVPRLPTIDDVDLRDYDFVDLGASIGGSLEHAAGLFGGRGLGVDIDPRKVQRARELGRDVVVGDCLELPSEPLVRFAVLDNFLEHLPSLEHVREMLHVAGHIANDFVYIVHPSFEHEEYLNALGLRQYWHDWHGHPTHILLLDFEQILADTGGTNVAIHPLGRIRDSSHDSILPLSAPPDQHHYDPSKHGRKPLVQFDRPLYERYVIEVSLNGRPVPRARTRSAAVVAGRAARRLTTMFWPPTRQNKQDGLAAVTGAAQTATVAALATSTGSSDHMRTLEDVDLRAYDFFDFGAGDGGSLRRAVELFGGRGLGIDIDRKKITRAQEAGLEIVHGDITALPREKLVRYVFLDNFLEHLPDYGVVQQMLDVAAAVAEEFIYIRHPSFEDEAYLAALGLKQYWADWTGHPSRLLLHEFCAMFKRAGLGPIEVHYAYPVLDSSDPSILPASTEPDQFDYDPERHGPKPLITFSRPVHKQIRIKAYVRGAEPVVRSSAAGGLGTAAAPGPYRRLLNGLKPVAAAVAPSSTARGTLLRKGYRSLMAPRER